MKAFPSVAPLNELTHARTHIHTLRGGTVTSGPKPFSLNTLSAVPRYEGAQLLVRLSWRGDLRCLCNTVTQVFITEPLHFLSSPPTHALLFTRFLSHEKPSDYSEVLIGRLCFKIHDSLFFLFQAASKHVSMVRETDVPR